MSEQQRAIELLNEIAELMKLNADNPFKIRAFERAADSIADVKDLKKRALDGTLTEIDGVGKGIAETLTEFLIEGTSTQRDELRAKLPEGLLELTQVPGLGPKKALSIIETLGIRTLAELEYACKENRLAHLKGFGEKMQAKVLEGVAFIRANSGSARLDVAEAYAAEFEAAFHKNFAKMRLERAGELERRHETLRSIDFLFEGTPDEKITAFSETYARNNPSPVPLVVHSARHADFDSQWIELTASKEWLDEFHVISKKNAALAKRAFSVSHDLLETPEMLHFAIEGELDSLLGEKDVQGIFHVHTTRSDGAGSLSEMIEAAERAGYSYIGITDHSQSAFYARGLKASDLKAQRKELDAVRKEFPKMTIFWGIESDILADGSLDYDDKLLAEFDFVIASIHSRFQMNHDEMTERLLKAIANPYTTMLGHLTGRLLLGRPAYAFDLEKIVKACAKHDVAIEINSHPARLDIDWRHGDLLRKYQVKVAINPDAHEVAGLADTRFGVTVARKALLNRKLVVNTMGAKEVAAWFSKRRRA